jgi:hypothetical protein
MVTRDFKIQKFANALVPGAVTFAWVNGDATLKHIRKKYGGLWVSGKVTVTPDGIRFAPNGMNKALHVGLESVHIPLAGITSVHREFGWLTGIVVVKHVGGEFRFRCFGAKQTAKALESRMPGTRSLSLGSTMYIPGSLSLLC